MGKIRRFLCVVVILFFTVFVSSGAYSYNFPDYTATFHGDADGNEYLQTGDLSIHVTQMYESYSPDYATFQYNDDENRMATCDMDGDAQCQTGDLSDLVFVAYGGWLTTSLLHDWTILLYEAPGSIDQNVETPIILNVQAYSDIYGEPIGRPGMVVQVNVINDTTGTGDIYGRSCYSVSGNPDEGNWEIPDMACATGVTRTRWNEDLYLGLTENADSVTDPNYSPYGLKIKATSGAGTQVHLQATLMDQGQFNIYSVPPLDIYLDVKGGGIPDAIDITNCSPNPVDELTAMTCDVTTTNGKTAVIDTGLDSCTGAYMTGSGSPYTYHFTPTEAQGPGACTAAVALLEDSGVKDNEAITINEVNVAPTDNAPASTTGNELTAISFAVSPTDPDIPLQTLTCEVVSNACPAGTLSSCVWSGWTPTEAQGPTSCDVVTRAYDGVAYSTPVTTHVKILEVNVAPVDHAPASTTQNEGSAVSFAVGPTDVDIPSQGLTCDLVSNACPAGTLSSCVWSGWTPTEAQGPTSCDVVTRAYDGVAYSTPVTTHVKILEVNVAPVDHAPASTTGNELTAISFAVSPTDVDIPLQTLTCEVVSNACPGGPGAGPLAGCVWSWTPTEAQGPTACAVVTRAYDGVAYSSNVTTTVNVNEVNVIPTWTSTPSAISGSVPFNYDSDNGVGGDTDLPNTGGTDPGHVACSKVGSDTCTGFDVTVTSTGTGNGTVNCHLAFSATVGESCSVTLRITDGYGAAATPDQVVSINLSGGNATPDFTELPNSTSMEQCYTSHACSFLAHKTDANAGDILTGSMVYSASAQNAVITATSTTVNDTTSDNVNDAANSNDGGTTPITNDTRTAGDGKFTVTQNMRLEFYPFNTSAIPADASITAVTLRVRYTTRSTSSTNTYNGSAFMQCKVGAGAFVDTSFAPGYQSVWTSISEPLLDHCAMSTKTDLASAQIGFTNNSARNRAVHFDYVALQVSYNTNANDTCKWGTVTDTPGTSGSTTIYGGTTGATTGVCTVLLKVKDNYSPPASVNEKLYVNVNAGAGIALQCNNPGPNPVGDNSTMTCFIASSSDAQVSPSSNTCAGSIVGSNYVFTPAETQGGSTCTASVRLISTPATHSNVAVTINEQNQNPYFSTQPPYDIVLQGVSSTYNNASFAVDTDNDLPNTAAGNPGYIASTTVVNNTCGFTPTVSGGVGAPPRTLTVGFTFNGTSCSFALRATDGYGGTGDSISVNVWYGPNVSQVIAVQPAVPTPAAHTGGLYGPQVARVANNYPPDPKKVVVVFNKTISACSGVVMCTPMWSATPVNVPVTGTATGTNEYCTLTAGSAFPSTNNCVLSGIGATPTCGNCTGTTVAFHTALQLTECAATGGTCGGFIDNVSAYGSATSVFIDVVKKENFAKLDAASIEAGRKDYLQFEQNYDTPMTVSRQEAFVEDGNFQVVAGSSAPAKITVGFKGLYGSCFKDQATTSAASKRDCFQLTTVADLDARRIIIPLEYTATEVASISKLYVTGDVGITTFASMVGNAAGYTGWPNPLRLGFVSPVFRNMSLADLSLDYIFQPDTLKQTLTICYGSNGNNTITTAAALPQNILIPDLIRTAQTNCSGGWTSGPKTSWRVYSNDPPGITRTMMVIGGQANSGLYNLDTGLNIAVFPIFLKALGTWNYTAPSTTYVDQRVVALGATPLEFDYRDPGLPAGPAAEGPGAGGGRTVWGLMPRAFPNDRDRIAMGTSPVLPQGIRRTAPVTRDDLPYGDPNRWEQTNWATGGQFVKNGALLALGGRVAGATGSDPGGITAAQLHMTSKVDDSHFTFFARPHGNGGIRPSFSNDNPWSGSTSNTGVVSERMTGVPSNATPGQINFNTLEDALSFSVTRPTVQIWVEGGLATTDTAPGNTLHSKVINDLVPGAPISATEFMDMPDVTSPTHDGYYIAERTGLRPFKMSTDVPINRDGQIWRGTAGYTNGAPGYTDDTIGYRGGAPRFTITAPGLNVDSTRYPDYMVMYLSDGRGYVDHRIDGKNPRGDLNSGFPFNRYWKFYGNMKGKAGTSSYELTIPYLEIPTAGNGQRTIGGVADYLPRPWQGYGPPATATSLGTATRLEWDMIDVIIGTKQAEGGEVAVFDYQNQGFNWFNTGNEYASSAKHQFIWHR